MKRIVLTAAFLFACLLTVAHAELTLPAVFASDMVLQRGIALPVWGWADAGETVEVSFAGQTRSTTADADGNWLLKLEPLSLLEEAATFTVTAGSDDAVVCTNVLVGDVWICSGQSNMQFPVSGSVNGQDEVAAADLPEIRLFFVPNVTAPFPKDDCDGKWKICSPDTVSRFTAVGFFFGRHLNRELGVPIGLIGTSWGGTIAEAWTGESSLRKHLPEFNEKIVDVQELDQSLGEVMQKYKEEIEVYNKSAAKLYELEEDVAAATKGRAAADYDDAAWDTMELPGNWEQRGHAGLDGIVWFRKEIELPESWAGKELILRPGPIDEVDVTWFNGKQVGARGNSRGRETGYWNVPREYRVPGDVVKAGTNVVAIRVSDMMGQGGLWGAPADTMYLELADGSDEATIPLAGPWRYEIEYEMPKKPRNPDSPNRPTVLFNGMINPLIPFGITGAIWYQGEANASRAEQYRTLLPTMINDWRMRWELGDFPFLVVQLANFRPRTDEPVESGWAELREAQSMTAARDPKVGLAVAIDIGEAEDIHPKNKQEVGRRLALAAEAIAYDRDLPFSGPVFESMVVKDGVATLSFKHTDGGLVAKDGPLEGFAIAGSDGEFVWAEAEIKQNRVVVSSPDVAKPAAVRYGWANNPACNLYNGAGLPAVPFRTDGP